MSGLEQQYSLTLNPLTGMVPSPGGTRFPHNWRVGVRAAHHGEAGQVRQLLADLVPEYRPGERGEDERMRR